MASLIAMLGGVSGLQVLKGTPNSMASPHFQKPPVGCETRLSPKRTTDNSSVLALLLVQVQQQRSLFLQVTSLIRSQSKQFAIEAMAIEIVDLPS
jgi:hypothetical protein